MFPRESARTKVPRMTSALRLGTYPTPVQRIASLSVAGAELWVKRDDLTSPLYGGNKVRKLEHVLAEARDEGAERLVTVGAAGSHHVLATTIYGRAAGFVVEAVLVPQPRTEHVVLGLRADLAQGLVPFPVRSWGAVPFVVAQRVLAGAHYVHVGGSSVAGAMGYVDAARELAAQVRTGAMPEPDLVVVTLGSGGTAAGLAAGFELEGLRTKVVAVCIATPPLVLAWTARTLARACVRRAGCGGREAEAAADRLIIDGRYYGAGYGHATSAGDEAMKVWARAMSPSGADPEGLPLDATYTAKTFAAALDLLKSGETATPKTILYWHTLSSAPMDPLLRGGPNAAPAEEDLAPRLRRLLL